MKPRTFSDFCRQVAKLIRFSPDRPAVEEELCAHLEDSREALLTACPEMTISAAEEAAIAAMGDPEELGRALNLVHSPLLGWVQIWFRRAVWTLAALVLLLSLPKAGTIVENLTGPVQLDNIHIGSLLERYEELDLVADDRPTAQWSTADYGFTVERAIVTRSGGALSLSYLLKVTHKSPWLRGPEFRSWLRAEDDLGNRYPSRGEQHRDDLPTRLGDSAGNPAAVYPFVSYYDLWVTGIDPDAAEVTLVFDRYGEKAISLTIPLKGGGAHA